MIFCIRVVCLLFASSLTINALAQDLSGWSDKTLCRLLKANPDNKVYNAELNKRDQDCDSNGIQPSWRIFNDFSQEIYSSEITIQPSGYHPSAVSISNGIAQFTLTPEMYAINTTNVQRFEIGKQRINPSLATKTKFKFRSDNNPVSDRVLISQIKSAQKSANGGGPIASVYLDRPPQCSTFSREQYYPEGSTRWVGDSDQFSTDYEKGFYVYTQQNPNGFWEYVWMTNLNFNRSYDLLNDGEWHDIELHAYPHRTKGFCRILIDGELILNIENAPTKSYDYAKHGLYAARIGLYRDSVDYNQTVEFDDLEIIGYRP